MASSVAIVVISALLAAAGDCGKADHLQAIATTEALVLKRVALDIPFVEMPQGEGTDECARIVFRIDTAGRAADPQVVESSRNIILNLAAMRALAKYEFQRSASDDAPHMLVFQGKVGAAPPYPPGH